jgi:hypothetical protein
MRGGREREKGVGGKGGGRERERARARARVRERESIRSLRVSLTEVLFVLFNYMRVQRAT